MRYWLKSGLIGAGIAIILIIVLNFLDKITELNLIALPVLLGSPWSIILSIIFVAQAPSVSNAAFMLYCNIGGIIGLILNGFIIGAIIGKIKSQKHKNAIKPKKKINKRRKR